MHNEIFNHLSGFEINLMQFVQQHRIEVLDKYFLWITKTAYLLSFMLIIITYLYGVIKKISIIKLKALKIAFCLLFNTVIISILKFLFERTRPFQISDKVIKLSEAHSPSFPSGHTAYAFLIAFSFFYLFPKNKILTYSLLIWSVFVAYSRIMLGVHFPTDVAASFILSPVDVAIGLWLFRYLKVNDKLFKI